jgi:hypothetical protein
VVIRFAVMDVCSGGHGPCAELGRCSLDEPLWLDVRLWCPSSLVA